MSNFTVEPDAIELPRGAWAQNRRVNILWRGRHITSLSQGRQRAYLFPVYTPAGHCLTAESPIDHPHHNSIWIGADHVVCRLPFGTDRYEEATYNFYVNETFQGRAAGRIVETTHDYEEVADDRLRVTQTLSWQGPPEWAAPEGRVMITETRTIAIKPGPVFNRIDIRSQLRSTEWEVHIGPTRHAYFGVRLADTLHATRGATIVDAQNRLGVQQITGQISDWVDCSGNMTTNCRAGVTLLSHPTTSGIPWHVTDWGLLTLNPMADQEIVLREDEVIDYSIRLLVHDGDAEDADIETESYTLADD